MMPEQHEAARQARATAMQELRAAVKAKRGAIKDIAHTAGKSPSWVGEVLRGGYPFYGANCLPRHIARALEACGFRVPEVLGPPEDAAKVPSTPGQHAYLERLVAKVQGSGKAWLERPPTPPEIRLLSKARASELIDMLKHVLDVANPLQ